MTMKQPSPTSALAAAVRDARLSQGWSKEEAARRAGINSTTWNRVEQGLSVQDHKLNAIEVALGWEHGRAFRLKGGDVTPADNKPAPTGISDDELLAIIQRQRAELDEIERRLRGERSLDGA